MGVSFQGQSQVVFGYLLSSTLPFGDVLNISVGASCGLEVKLCNYRMHQVGKDPQSLSSSTPCSQQGHLKPDQVWPWMCSGMGPEPHLWSASSTISLPSLWRISVSTYPPTHLPTFLPVPLDDSWVDKILVLFGLFFFLNSRCCPNILMPQFLTLHSLTMQQVLGTHLSAASRAEISLQTGLGKSTPKRKGLSSAAHKEGI